ncbi:MAG: insulinase family protein [Actinobacteria bacterium]|uniref:Unannotated protein n=1 Tax=freshwater metagenome TaxID=449393 RepID=A0A6J6QGN4_9ZZZZ|nr:insulinase family protein [Actinomycetota bacterium]
MQSWTLTELDSGERIVSEKLDHVRSIALGIGIGVGSRDEKPARAGVSHFIEHLLFKGTPSYTALDIAEIFDEMGGELNASTSREQTTVYARVPDVHLAKTIDVTTEMVFSPLLADIDSEREVVLEEIAMVEDDPQDLVHDLISEAVFGNHPLGRPVIGTADVIRSVSRRSLLAYHRQMYTPANVVVAAAGNVDHAQLVELVERSVAKREAPSLPGAPHVRPALVKTPPPQTCFLTKDTEQYHVCLGAPGLARGDRRRFAASVLDAILGGSASSRLFQEIREKRGMAYSVYSYRSEYSDAGHVGVYVGTREDNLGVCLEIAAEQIAEIAAGRVTDREIRRAKDSLKGRILLTMESTSARMSRLGRAIMDDAEILSVERLEAEIEAVEADAVADLAALLLAPGNVSVAGIGPREDKFEDALARIAPDRKAAA